MNLYDIDAAIMNCINEDGETEVLNKADRSLRVLDWYKK